MTARRSDMQLLVQEESSFGTAAALEATGAWRSMPFIEWDPDPRLERTPDDVIPAGAPTAAPANLVDGLQSVNWRAVVPAGKQSLGWWFKMMFGDPSTTGTDPNYVHIFGAKDVPTIPSFSVHEYHSVVNRRFLTYGAFCNRMSLSATRAGRRARLEFSGQAVKWAKTSLDADDDPIIYADDDAQVELQGDIYYTPSGGSETKIENVVTGINMVVENDLQLDTEAFNGTDLATQRTASRWSISGTVNLRFKDFTFTDLAAQGTNFSLEFRLISGTNNRINLIAQSVKFGLFAPKATGGVIVMNAPFQGEKPSSGDSFTARISSQAADYD